MENTLENKILFLYQNLKSEVIGDFSRYIKVKAPVNGDVTKIHGYINGINKSLTQQFDIDFSINGGFEFYNCFNDLCRHWAHTIHAEHLTVIKKVLSEITDEDAIECHKIHNSYNTTPYDYSEKNIQRYIKNTKQYIINPIEVCIPSVIDYLRSKGYALPYMGLSVEQLIEYGWIKLKED